MCASQGLMSNMSNVSDVLDALVHAAMMTEYTKEYVLREVHELGLTLLLLLRSVLNVALQLRNMFSRISRTSSNNIKYGLSVCTLKLRSVRASAYLSRMWNITVLRRVRTHNGKTPTHTHTRIILQLRNAATN